MRSGLHRKPLARRRVSASAHVQCLNNPHERACSLCAGGGIISPTLDVPTPFAAADVIERETGARDRVAFHYAIVEVAARVEDPLAPPVAAGDVDDARWVPVNELESFPGLTDSSTHYILCDSAACTSAMMLAAIC